MSRRRSRPRSRAGPTRASATKNSRAIPINTDDDRIRRTIELSKELIGFPRQLGTHPGGFVLTEDRLDDACPHRAGRHGRSPGHRMGQGGYRRSALHEGRCAGARHAGLHAPRLRPVADPLWRKPHPRHHPEGRSCNLCHDREGRYARHLPDRKPRADGHAAAHQAAHLLRSRHSGGDCPARPDPGRHGAPLPQAGAQGRSRSPTPRPNWSASWARRSACRCSRNRPCRSRSIARASRRARPTSSAAPWRPSR